MHLLLFCILLPLTLALPNLKRQSQSCSAQEWNIQQPTTFTVGSTPAPGAPPIFAYDHISFYFDDPNFNTRTLCERSVEPGTGRLADDNLYPCDGNNMSFSYAGASVNLKRTGVKCDNATFTESGSTGLSLDCHSLFGGTQCETVTQINVPVSFLEQTGL